MGLKVHIVPRKRGDGLRGFFWPRHKETEEELAAVQATLLTALHNPRQERKEQCAAVPEPLES